MSAHALRGRVFWFTADPEEVGDNASYRLIDDGFIAFENGIITASGEARDLPSGIPVDHHPGCLIMPGFIDTHIHSVQTQVIASYGAQLLDWLNNYTFIEEQRFADPEHAANTAAFFLDELFRNGTTTAVVYGSVHKSSAEALFAASHQRNSRMIAGKVMMDQHAPKALLDTAEQGYLDSQSLIDRWHDKGRQSYAISPRFALTSSKAQLDAAGVLLREHPDCYLQTHLSENLLEIETAKQRHAHAKHYTDIYDQAGLLGERSIFGHCIHLTADERRRLSETGSKIAFCPTSNLFIGSGLLDRRQLRNDGIDVTLATDVGGGTSYSMLRTAAEAYKILQLNNQNLPALAAFHQMTRGNAKALHLDHEIGTLEKGSAADIIVLNPNATPAMAHRMQTIEDDIAEILFLLMTMGDDRAVSATWVAGQRSSNQCEK